MKYFSGYFLFFLFSFSSLAQSFGPGSGNCLVFDGVNDRVNIPDAASFNHPANNISMEAWINPSAYTVEGEMIFSNVETNPNREYYIYIEPGGLLRFILVDNSDLAYFTRSTTVMPLNSWTHVAATYSFATGIAKIYINGVLNISNNIGSIVLNTTSIRPMIGAYWFSNNNVSRAHFQGMIDEVRLWYVERSQTEIRDNMCRILVTPQANLIAYYRLDEASGLTAKDASGNGNDGTLQNFAAVQTNDWNFSGAPIGDESINLYTSSWTGINLILGSSPPGSDEGTMAIDNISGNPEGFHLYRVDQLPSQTDSLDKPLNTYFGTFVVGGSSPAYSSIYKYAGTAFDSVPCEWNFKLAQRNDNSVAVWTLLNSTVDTLANSLTSNNTSRKEIILDTLCINICPPLSVNLGPDRHYCSNPFTDNLDAGISGVNYLWSTGASSKTIPVSNPGIYWVEISSPGCSYNRDSIVLSGYNAPALGLDRNICNSASVTLDAGTGWDSYLWSTGNQSQTVSITTSGDYFVVVSNAYCTLKSDTVGVNFYLAPSLGNDTTIICKGTIFTLDAGAGWTSYQWSDNSAGRSLQVTQKGQYYVAVSNAFCAFQSDTVFINVLDQDNMIIPTLITPDGDGRNDQFTIPDLAPNSSIEIFNVWGGLIYKSNEYSNDWKPENNSDGVYFYHLKSDCGILSKGWLHVIR